MHQQFGTSSGITGKKPKHKQHCNRKRVVRAMAAEATATNCRNQSENAINSMSIHTSKFWVENCSPLILISGILFIEFELCALKLDANNINNNRATTTKKNRGTLKCVK